MSPQPRRTRQSTPANEELFSPVTVGRTSQLIADQIRTLVRDGRLTPGDRLPSERDLCERFGVSRVTVREALRVLEANGLVEVRVGARGGAIVSTPSSEALGQGLADLLTLSSLTAAQVTEARMIFEFGIIPLIVERATETDIAELRELVEHGQLALDAGQYRMSMSAAFHVRLAASTHNRAIEMLVHSFHGPMLMSLREAQVAEPLMGHRGTREHLQIVEAIEARDAEQAGRIMRDHLQRTYDRVAT